MKRTTTFDRMNEIEQSIVPLEIEKKRLQKIRDEAERRYREAFARGNQRAVARFDQVLADASKAVAAILAELGVLNRRYSSLQRTLVL